MPRSSLRRAAATLVALAASSLAACGDPLEIAAQFETAERTIAFHALSGTSIVLPAAALVAPLPQAVRPDAQYLFDLAFDIDAGGVARLFPVNVVAAPGVASGRQVGIQLIENQGYDDIARAPGGTYEAASAVEIAVGDVGVVQSANHPSCAGSFLSTVVFAKFRVEAIDPASRRLTLRVRTNPNCGFRGLETGLPSR